MDRRNFLRMMVGGVAAAAAVRTFPFRVFSFPSELRIWNLLDYRDCTALQLENVIDQIPDLFGPDELPALFGRDAPRNRTATGIMFQYREALHRLQYREAMRRFRLPVTLGSRTFKTSKLVAG